MRRGGTTAPTKGVSDKRHRENLSWWVMSVQCMFKHSRLEIGTVFYLGLLREPLEAFQIFVLYMWRAREGCVGAV